MTEVEKVRSELEANGDEYEETREFDVVSLRYVVTKIIRVSDGKVVYNSVLQ